MSSKPNWLGMPLRPMRKNTTVSFADAGTGAEFSFTLRPLTLPEQFVANELAESLKTQFVTGNPDEGMPPMRLDGYGDGENESPLTDALLQNVAVLATMQPPHLSEEERYSPVDLLAMFARVDSSTSLRVFKALKSVQDGKDPNAAGQATTL